VVNIGIHFAVDLAGAGIFAGHRTGAPLFFKNRHRAFQIESFGLGRKNGSCSGKHYKQFFHKQLSFF
jgi:hypothetical protein